MIYRIRYLCDSEKEKKDEIIGRQNEGTALYFIDETHENNYYSLYTYYGQKGKSEQYRSNIYLASVPDIFHLIELKGNGSGPLIPLTEHNEKNQKLVPSHPGLTGSTRKLVEVGLSLYNGTPADLISHSTMTTVRFCCKR